MTLIKTVLLSLLCTISYGSTQTIQAPQLMNQGTFSFKDCQGYDCEDQVWCYSNNARPIVKFRQVWDHIVFQVDDTSNDWCLIGESDDSTFSFSAVQDRGNRDALIKRLSRRNERQGGTSGAFFNFMEDIVLQAKCRKSITFSPFGTSCVKVVPGSTNHRLSSCEMNVRHESLRVAYPRQLVLGYILISAAPLLSGLLPFYYACGMLLGVMLSLTILSYFLLRWFSPSRKGNFIVGLFVQSIFGVFAFAADLGQNMLDRYPQYALGYIFVTVLGSFAVTHWMLKGSSIDGKSGPSQSFQDIVRWTIQFCGYGLILWSSASTTWAITNCLTIFFLVAVLPFIRKVIVCFLFWIDPNRDVVRLRRDQHYLARPFLTMEEFEQEGIEATAAATETLYQSRAFQAWLKSNIDRIQVRSRFEQQR